MPIVKLIEKMESAKYTIKEAVQVIQVLDFGELALIITYLNNHLPGLPI